jgi:hypothetical protein
VFNGRRTASIDVLLRRNTGARSLGLVWYDGTANVNIVTNAMHPAWANNQMVWLRARVDATQVTFSYNETDTETEPTTWTAIGTPIARTGGTMQHLPPTAAYMIGATSTTPSPFNGRITRTIIRNPATGAKVLDISGADANAVAPGGLGPFLSNDPGRLPVTVVQTAPNQVVTALPDALVWRFDANDWPPGATSVVGAAGRTWTAADPAALQHPASQPD